MSNEKKNLMPKWLQLGNGVATVTLSRRSKANGVMVDTLTIREPTVKECRFASAQAGDNEEEQELALFCTLATIGREELEGLLMRDYRRLQTAYFRVGTDDGI